MPNTIKRKAMRHQFIFFIAEILFTFTKANVVKTPDFAENFNTAHLTQMSNFRF